MWKFRKIKLSKDLKSLLKIYFKEQYEVGGIIFAKRYMFYTMLETISFKKGAPLSICFDNQDVSLFEIPKGNIIIGTWHTHPFQKEIQPSNIDLKQWKKWKKEFIHLIYNGNKIKLYTSKGELIYVKEI